MLFCCGAGVPATSVSAQHIQLTSNPGESRVAKTSLEHQPPNASNLRQSSIGGLTDYHAIFFLADPCYTYSIVLLLYPKTHTKYKVPYAIPI